MVVTTDLADLVDPADLADPAVVTTDTEVNIAFFINNTELYTQRPPEFPGGRFFYANRSDKLEGQLTSPPKYRLNRHEWPTIYRSSFVCSA